MPAVAASKVKMSGSEKKGEREQSKKIFCKYLRHFLLKTCNQEVSRYQNNGKEMYKKKCAARAICFCFCLDLLIFLQFSLPHHLALSNFVLEYR